MVAVGLHPDELASCELINRVLKNDNMDFANEIQRLVEVIIGSNACHWMWCVFAHN